MLEQIFFINSALSVNQLSVYSDEERFSQTLETLDSIDKYCPNNAKYIFDSSPYSVDQNLYQMLANRGAYVLVTGNHSDVKNLSLSGQRSIAECISFLLFLDWFKKNEKKAKRIYKISGRYQLTSDFKNIETEKNSFIFCKALNSWMSQEQQKISNVDKLYRLRLWGMDYNLIFSFEKELENILKDCERYAIDVEHAYYKNLKKYEIKELEKIGVCGNIAPTGEYIEE